MTLVLSIDTSTKNCSVSISKDSVLLYTIEELSESFTHAEKLHVFCEKIVKKLNISFTQIDAYGFSAGPGSYTGLRIGAAAVKGFAFCFNKPVVLLSTLKCLANFFKKEDGLICSLIDSRKDEVYMSLYDFEMNNLVKPHSHIINKSSLKNYLSKSKVYFVGTGLYKMQNILCHKNAVEIKNIFPSSKYMIEEVHRKIKKKKFADISNFEPMYLKDFVATPQKKNLI
tara:strand:- start:561 stop:1241 length:681 start_codon:yes stop_codon:yes gene_type:complete